ncbi:hypothetical protein [Flavisolibacter tropicus]|nr:hypothetical protein [Flavisolibacter tropicus]
MMKEEVEEMFNTDRQHGGKRDKYFTQIGKEAKTQKKAGLKVGKLTDWEVD